MAQMIPIERIEKAILLIRNRKVLLDSTLAELYGVQVKVFNQAVKRNLKRFPSDFMFQLNEEEYKCLRSQFVTLKQGKNIKYLPTVFTEYGAEERLDLRRNKDWFFKTANHRSTHRGAPKPRK